MQKATNFNDVAIVSVKKMIIEFFFWYMTKSNAINMMKNFKLNE